MVEFQGSDRFELLRRLGSGGMGVVYEALDRQRRAHVALKTLRTLDADARMRLKQEFRALQGLSHPNLIELGELIEESGHLLLTMELVDGVDFLQYVRGASATAGAAAEATTLHHSVPAVPLTPGSGTAVPEPDEDLVAGVALIDVACDQDRLRRALDQLVGALTALHEAGKLHRDIKPSNILVSGDERVVLVDFGLVSDRRSGSLSGRGEVLGTPAYMAPEQAVGMPATPASDWYAVGVLLYEALTGRLPFRGSVVQIMTAKCNRPPRPPDEYVPDVPADLAQLCMELLDRDPARRPSGYQVLARLGKQRHVVTAGPLLPTLFLRREREAFFLADALAAARRQGAPVTVFVHGPAGVGKSALVADFCESARRRGAIVLAGRCYERERLPFKAVDSAIDALGRHLRRLDAGERASLAPGDVAALVRVFPALAGAFDEPDATTTQAPHARERRRLAFAALKELLGHLARDSELVLWIDDLQWGDVDSASLLLELLRPPAPPPLLLIASHRSDAGDGAMLRALRRPAVSPVPLDVRDLPVEALEPEQAEILARRLLGPGHRDVARDIAREAEGLPRLIGELVRYWRSAPDARLPVRLADALRARIAALSAPERHLLELVAVADRPLPVVVVAEAAGVRGALAPFDSLVAAHLVRTSIRAADTELVECYHDRVRDQIVASVGARAPALSAALAEALEAHLVVEPAVVPAEALADLWEAAGRPGDAVAHALRAARRAERALAFEQAAELYGRVLASSSDAPSTALASLHARRAECLANAGRPAEAARAYLSAAASGDRLAHEREAAAQLLLAGHAAEGIEVMRRVLPAYGMRWPARDGTALATLLWRRARVRLRGLRVAPAEAAASEAERARFDVCWSTAIGLSVADPVRAAAFVSLASLVARRTRDVRQLAIALASEALVAATSGHRNRARTAALIERAQATAERARDPYVDGWVELASGTAAYLEGRFVDAVPRFESAAGLLRRVPGAARETANAEWFAIESLQFLGELSLIRTTLPALRREADRRGDRFLALTLRITAGPQFAWIAADQCAFARAEVDDCLAGWQEEAFDVRQIYEMYALTPIEMYEGEYGRAFRRLDEGWSLARRHHWLRIQITRVNLHLFRAMAAIGAARAGDPDAGRLTRLARRAAGRLELERVGYAEAYVASLRANLAALAGEEEACDTWMAESERRYRLADMSLHAALCRYLRGARLGGARGAALQEAGQRVLAAQGVRRPERYARIWWPAVAPDDAATSRDR